MAGKDKEELDKGLTIAMTHAEKVIKTAKEKGLLPVGLCLEDVPETLILAMGWHAFAKATSDLMVQELQPKDPTQPNRHLRRVKAKEERTVQ